MTADVRNPRGKWRRCPRLMAAGLLVLACHANNPIDTGGETHFLKSCSAEDDTCGGLACVCGVCTALCDEDDACTAFPGATCLAPGEHGTCPSAEPRCDVECRHDDDCALVSPFHVCDDGTCRTRAPFIGPASGPVEAGSSSALTTMTSDIGSPPVASRDGSAPSSDEVCEAGTTRPNEVLILGDSFFGKTHQITAYLEALSRANSSLPEGERFRDGSRTVANTLAGITEQYSTAIADGPIRVVVMNGGGADALIAQCDPIDSNCPELVNAAGVAEALLTTMASDGVAQVIYAFYPDPSDEALRSTLDALRPLVSAACTNAALACHWLDLREAFAGHEASYMAADGSLPTAAGSEASAQAIWRIMQDNCIAQ